MRRVLKGLILTLVLASVILPGLNYLELEGTGLFFLENPLLVKRYSSSNRKLARILPSSCGQHSSTLSQVSG